MLKKVNRLAKKKDFNAIMKARTFFSPFFIIKFRKTDSQATRFGIIISKKVSKFATKRNLIKRRLSEILRLNISRIAKSYDVVLIVSPKIIDEKGKVLNYKDIENNLFGLLSKARLI